MRKKFMIDRKKLIRVGEEMECIGWGGVEGKMEIKGNVI